MASLRTINAKARRIETIKLAQKALADELDELTAFLFDVVEPDSDGVRRVELNDSKVVFSQGSTAKIAGNLEEIAGPELFDALSVRKPVLEKVRSAIDLGMIPENMVTNTPNKPSAKIIRK